jgi:hypothetical protein
MARNAFKWIIVALVVATLFVGATIVLARIQSQSLQSQSAIMVQVPIDSVTLPLDTSGIGTQYLPSATLSVKLEPYPPRVNSESTLRLIALDPTTRAVKSITATLSIADVSLVEGDDFNLERTPSGAYEASGRFFPEPGDWRLRVRIDFGEREPYSMLMLVEAT